MKTCPPKRTKLLITALGLLALFTTQVWADVVVYQSRNSSGGVTGNPPYREGGGGTWSMSSGPVLATPNTPPYSGSRFNTGSAPGGAYFEITPTLANWGNTYRVDIANTWSSNAGTDEIADISITAGSATLSASHTMAFAYGGITPPTPNSEGVSPTEYGVWSGGLSASVWVTACYMTNVTSGTTIRFTYGIGNSVSSGYSRRFWSGAFRFTEVPEPSTCALGGLALMLLGLRTWRPLS